MIRVYYARISDCVDESIVPSLSDYRQWRLSMMSNEKARRESICTELLLEKAVFPRYSRPLPIAVAEFGKPYFANSDLHFSLSHSGGLAACAIGECELGFDIHQERPSDLKLAKRFFSADEYEYVSSAEDTDKAFAEIWSKKESWIKASGIGMKQPLSSFSVLNNAQYWHTIIGDIHFSLCAPDEKNLIVDIQEIKLL